MYVYLYVSVFCVCVCVCTCVRVVGHGFWGSFPCFPCVKTADSGAEEEARRHRVNVIAIDISCIRNNSQVVIFGELDVLESTPYITAKITRECSNLNIQQNSSAVAIVQRLFPNILK
ncbi:uncharacterized protein LOC125032132 isoform X2 [Penaeus chinensis]|uniref:uncharacterized protein LOC125032132 isoform X2 n=1 Tax=Penaeus chinensis TaxID=139456 RepID=UPI001FB57E23|nr:uncharacterized protein LOC125032132 isoform X2 [Penaeus chinensis]